MDETLNVVSLATARERRASATAGNLAAVSGQMTFADGVERFSDDVADWCTLTNKMLAANGLSNKSGFDVLGTMAAQALTLLLREPSTALRIIIGNEGVAAALAPVQQQLSEPAKLSEQDFTRGQILCLFAKLYLPAEAFAVFCQDFV